MLDSVGSGGGAGRAGWRDQVPSAGGLPPGGAIEPQMRRGLAPVLNDAAASVERTGGPPKPKGGPDPAELALDLTQIGLDIVGIFEPTPFADGANTLISVGRGDWFGAVTSAAGMLPYLGDTAKLAKLGRWAETVGDAVRMASDNPALRRAIQPAMEKLDDALGAIPEGALKKLPEEAREALAEMRSEVDEFLGRGTREADKGYRGVARGEAVNLPNVEMRNVDYVKRDRDEYRDLRRAFDAGGRSDFLKSLASDPGSRARLAEAGLSEQQVARVAEGKVPDGFQVHHKLPLDDGGTNDIDNLVLIRHDPYHIAITNEQRKLTRGMEVGETRNMDFPIPEGEVYDPRTYD